MSKLTKIGLDEFDSIQTDVITSDLEDRLIVDAAPGTGKTAVACARIAHLVDEFGANPAKIWMVSFTRTAVAEIRARLYAYVGEDSFSIKVATLDAHAWSLHSGFEENASLTGSYDQNISALIDLIERDEETQDYLYEVQHLIIDEAQDIVGIRAKLVEEILKNLSSECGITIFADEAQAIYDFAEDTPRGEVTKKVGFLDGLKGKESGFQCKQLSNVYRTSCEGLQTIFTDIRREVLAPDGRSGMFSKIYDRIKSVVGDESPSIAKSPPWQTLSAGNLVLFRTRAEALQAAQFNQAPYSLRLGGYGGTLPPWLAICFSDWTDRYFDQVRFVARWRDRVRHTCPPSYEHEEAWQKLYRLAGCGDRSIDMWVLRQRLSRSALPVDLAEAEYGLSGPIIGTVHASKGREADDVLFYVANDPEFEDEYAEAEETRVLFVGSTRARRSLRIGKASRSYAKSLDSGRAYKKLKGNAAMLEIGRPGDQSLAGLVAANLQSAKSTEMSQRWLANHACVMTQLEFNADPERDWSYGALAPMEGTHLTSLSPNFSSDYWNVVAEVAGREKSRPAPRISYVKSLGAMTIVADPEDPELEILHSPWSQSGFALAPRLSAFTKVCIWSRN